VIPQAHFRAGLLDPTQSAPDGLLGPTGAAAGKRYDVYRNNVSHSLIEAMKTAFPLVQKLIGAQNFDGLAAMYVRAHPPKSPLMMFYGAEFPDFLAQFQPLSHIGYLADCATLDLALRQSYHAADAPIITGETLQSVPEAALGAVQFRTAPATVVITSPWPLFDIWRYNSVQDAPAPQAVAQDVLITRPEYDPAPHLLPAGGARWLAALNAGQSLDAAHETTLAAVPEFDLAACLTLALQTAALTD